MKNIISIVIIIFSIGSISAQNAFDRKVKSQSKNAKPSAKFELVNPAKSSSLQGMMPINRLNLKQSLDFRVMRDPETGAVMYLENFKKYPENKGAKRSAQAIQKDFLTEAKSKLSLQKPTEELKLVMTEIDEKGNVHSRYQQYYKGLKIYGAEAVLHSDGQKVKTLNGRVFETPEEVNVSPALNSATAIEKGLSHLSAKSLIQQNENFDFLKSKNEAELLVYYKNKKAYLAYELTLKPNILERWVVFMDAQSGEVIDEYNHTCTLDGVFTATARDLNGVNRTFKVFQSGNTYLLEDLSKPMFKSSQSQLPNKPVGGILTLDAQNSRIDQEPNLAHVTSRDNVTWDSKAVSAHYNASFCYDYYLNKFNRNSLNGSGSTIYSLINISDEDGKGMDNAYWNGEFMGYGNGRDAFKPLAGALDVAGHEMTHGVIENSAKLEYRNQSGALNESFADIFGAMIDRDDWKMGEDVVKTSVFPSGALRSLENPNQGGKNDPGYQPKTMAQYVFLRDVPSEDNGGVHVNSGIPNYAFYLFATANGMNKEKAERIYYQTLTKYLTRTSKFIDLRLAVIQAAKDLYGDTEVRAAEAAFDAVGITVQQGTPAPAPQTQIPVNTGTKFMAVYEPEGKDIYVGNQDGSGNFTIISNGLGCQRKPSITDDGSSLFFVSENNNIYYYDLTKTGGQPIALTNDGAWRNVAVSKNGKLLAALTTVDEDNITAEDKRIYIFNLENDDNRVFELYNPTYTSGVSTGEVLFPDSFEWDYSGEFLFYDAKNRAGGILGESEYWDVGVIKVFDEANNSFGSGQIQKIFTDLDEGDNIGNPTISKTDVNVMAFDYLDAINNKVYLLGLNLNTSELNILIENNEIGFPEFSIDDKFLSFNSIQRVGTNNNGVVVKLIPLNANKISTNATSGTRLFNEGQDMFAVFFANGTRKLPSKEAQTLSITVVPDQAPGATVTVSASSNSGLPILYKVISGDATVDGAQVKLGNTPGKVTIQAYQIGDDRYLASSIETTFCILPPKPGISSNGDVLTASGSAFYQWYLNNNFIGGVTNNANFNATLNGTYQVAGATQDGCFSELSNAINIQKVLSSNLFESDMYLFPNPAADKVYIKLSKGEIFKSAQIFDMSGRNWLQSSTEEIDISLLEKGTYLINIKTDQRQGGLKLVKE